MWQLLKPRALWWVVAGFVVLLAGSIIRPHVGQGWAVVVSIGGWGVIWHGWGKVLGAIPSKTQRRIAEAVCAGGTGSLAILISLGFSAATPLGMAEINAKSLVEKSLKTPSTAQWRKVKQIAHDENRYMVHVVVDAQNEFGAMLRSSYCVAFAVTGDQITWNRQFFTEPCSDPPTNDEIKAAKMANDWGTEQIPDWLKKPPGK